MPWKPALEIKYSIKHQNVNPVDIPGLDPTYHVELVDGKLNLKQKSKWYTQVQGVLGLDNCDFVLHTKRGIAIMPVELDTHMWISLKKKATQVFCKRIVPLL